MHTKVYLQIAQRACRVHVHVCALQSYSLFSTLLVPGCVSTRSAVQALDYR